MEREKGKKRKGNESRVASVRASWMRQYDTGLHNAMVGCDGMRQMGCDIQMQNMRNKITTRKEREHPNTKIQTQSEIHTPKGVGGQRLQR